MGKFEIILCSGKIIGSQVEIYQTENYSISPIQKYFKVLNRLHSVLGSICSARKRDHQI